MGAGRIAYCASALFDAAGNMTESAGALAAMIEAGCGDAGAVDRDFHRLNTR